MNDIIDADRQETKCSDCMSKSIELTNLLKHLTNLCFMRPRMKHVCLICYATNANDKVL